MDFIYFLDLLGTAVFAISGVLLAGRARMDPFGVLVLATVTAVGGGTIRDALLGATPVFWMTDANYLYVILVASLVSMCFARQVLHINRLFLPVLDAVGLAVFMGIGVTKALGYGANPMAAILMGVITGVGGGIIRDVLTQRIPLVLQKEIYATACLAGAIVHIGALKLGIGDNLAMLSGLFITLGIRLTAIRYQLQLPVFKVD